MQISHRGCGLFTKPYRSPILPEEERLLAKARCFDLAYKGGKLAVMEWGKGPAILCVHGWSSRGLRFTYLIEALADAGYRMVTFDAPAHGRSSGSHIDLMEYVDALMEVSGNVGSLYAIVAHSFGAERPNATLSVNGNPGRSLTLFTSKVRSPEQGIAGRVQFCHETVLAGMF